MRIPQYSRFVIADFSSIFVVRSKGEERVKKSSNWHGGNDDTSSPETRESYSCPCPPSRFGTAGIFFSLSSRLFILPILAIGRVT